MIKNLDFLIIKLDELEALLTEYVGLTNQLCGADFEELEETDRIIASRSALIDQMKVINPQISDIINEQDRKSGELIRKMLRGENVYGISANDENAVYSKILSLKSIQGEILQKDKVNSKRFLNKYNEVKNTLMDLKEDKKKIDYYSKSTLSGKGAEFNTNG